MRPGRAPLSLVALQARFCDEEKCPALLERARWPAGPTCPHCDVIGQASRLKARPGKFACLDWGNLGACTGTVAEVDHQIVNFHPSALSGLSWINWNHRPASVGITVRLRSEFAVADPRPGLVGDVTPLFARCLSVVLDKDGADPGGDDATLCLAGIGHGIAHDAHPASPPSGAQHLGDCGLQSLMRIGDDQLDTAQTATRERAQKFAPV